MTRTTDRIWRYRPTAALLLVACVLVLQGLLQGLAAGAHTTSAGLSGDTICLTNSIAARDSRPAEQDRPTRHFDVCVSHCASLGGAAPTPGFCDEAPRLIASAGSAPVLEHLVAIPPRRSPPVGSQAPPAIAL